MSSNARVWEARTNTAPTDQMLAYSESTDVDEVLLQADVAGSIAHVLGLHEAGLLDREETTKLVEGLQGLALDAREGTLELDPELEDVHMNVESQLEEAIGPLAGKLHAGRSRNDQVALDLHLVTRAGLAQVASHAHELATALVDLAGEHVQTPWTMKTHDQPAQPATLGFLLHAHALRLTRDVDAVLAVLDRHRTSPLGAGAGAGTTLPLDPAFTAELLGLDPLDNALLEAGARDGSLATVHALAQLGSHVQDLAVDLLELAEGPGVDLPAAYSTGSSIMPHKVNPDALELARADGAKLQSLAQQTHALTSGLGLGYDRDLQRAKQPVLEALDVAQASVAVLTSLVDGLEVDPDAVSGFQQPVSIATTDAVEALVQHGVPFRKAHQLLAEAVAASQEGSTLEDELQAADLDLDAVEAALDALEPDPTKRKSVGGPAPSRVSSGLETLALQLEDRASAIASATRQTQQPFTLLETPADPLVTKTSGGSA